MNLCIGTAPLAQYAVALADFSEQSLIQVIVRTTSEKQAILLAIPEIFADRSEETIAEINWLLTSLVQEGKDMEDIERFFIHQTGSLISVLEMPSCNKLK